jgi:hypothetical protein
MCRSILLPPSHFLDRSASPQLMSRDSRSLTVSAMMKPLAYVTPMSAIVVVIV